MKYTKPAKGDCAFKCRLRWTWKNDVELPAAKPIEVTYEDYAECLQKCEFSVIVKHALPEEVVIDFNVTIKLSRSTHNYLYSTEKVSFDRGDFPKYRFVYTVNEDIRRSAYHYLQFYFTPLLGEYQGKTTVHDFPLDSKDPIPISRIVKTSSTVWLSCPECTLDNSQCFWEQMIDAVLQLFDKHYGFRRVDLTLGRKVHWHFKQVLKWRLIDWAHFWMGRVPVTKWVPAYNWKKDLRADILGGLMLSIMALPQGLAYGYLVGVPPIYGLITAIFGPIFYAVFGTSRHTSPGCFAIAALMVGGVVEQYGAKPSDGQNNSTTPPRICCQASASGVPADEAVAIASSVTLLAGLWQIFFGLLNAGLLAVWLSDHLVQGLTSGAAVHVFTSQLKSITGADGVPPTSEAFGLIKIPCVVISSIAIFLLLLSNYFIDPILKKWTKVSFSTLIVFLADGTRFQINVPIVGKVESGIPAPRLPSLPHVDELVWQAISIAIISFVIHIALAKLISKKLNYEIDANQEWFALGAMNSIASLFGCFASGSSLGRTMMQVKFGTKSQMSTLVCCTMMVGFVYGAASFVYHLPKVFGEAVVSSKFSSAAISFRAF
nr:Sulphate transporter domain containing protein [Haemonchus contortus]